MATMAEMYVSRFDEKGENEEKDSDFCVIKAAGQIVGDMRDLADDLLLFPGACDTHEFHAAIIKHFADCVDDVVDDAKSEAESLTETCQSLQSERDELEEERDDAINERDCMESQVEELAQQLQMVESDMEKLSKQIAELRDSSIEDLNEGINDCEAEADRIYNFIDV